MSSCDKVLSYQSVTIVRVCMKLLGLWHVDSKGTALHSGEVYTALQLVCGTAIVSQDVYFAWGDFYEVTYNLCSLFLIITILIKFVAFVYYRDTVRSLILFAQTNFWNLSYDEHDTKILLFYDTKAIMLTYSFMAGVNMVALHYVLGPIFENIGRNETIRMLPLKIWLDFLPFYETPYFEVSYAVETLCITHIGISTFCFDNFLCVFNVQVASQLKILAHRIETLTEKCLSMEPADPKFKISPGNAVSDTYVEVKKCINKHRSLILCMDQMECIFSVALLAHLVFFSMITCMVCFQIVTTQSMSTKILFMSHLFASMVNLLLITWACEDVIVQSSGIADAAYHMRWYNLPYNETGRLMRYASIIISTRARKPCFLTAGKFIVLSQDTFTSILSTTMSYFMLLKNMTMA